jgi:hypothetical protein
MIHVVPQTVRDEPTEAPRDAPGECRIGAVRPRVLCREIQERELDEVADLLGRGFPLRSRAYWVRALERLKAYSGPAGYPKFGYLLQGGERIAGVLLMIHARTPGSASTETRCNLSSWYVEPEFRSYAPLLVAKATRHRDVTYVNTSPAMHTRPIIEAQGFASYSRGVFVAIPALSPGSAPGARILPATASLGTDADERRLLRDHEGYGCLSLWCATNLDAHPFVFARRRRIAKVLPCLHLIYCRDVQDFARFAQPVGRHLAARGIFFVAVDANGPIDGLAGRFFARGPKYYKGPNRPRLGDLAYMEAALFGDLGA